MTELDEVVRRELRAPTTEAVRAVAAELAKADGAVAVLFYGSNLRTGSSEGVLDFYILTAGPRERGMWPTVGYRELDVDGERLRAKIATMRLATFADAAAARTLDTTIWTRFVQPSALVWARDDTTAEAVAEAITEAAKSAARFAAALGPDAGTAADFWRALFRHTYAAEFRVEKSGREAQILAFDPARYDTLLPLAWAAGAIGFTNNRGVLRPALPGPRRASLIKAWAVRRRMGKPINIARLVRAAFTFDGAARYGAWKIERHTGIPVPLTPWREAHPLLAAPGVFWRLYRARRAS